MGLVYDLLGVAYWIQKTNVEGIIYKWPGNIALKPIENRPADPVPQPALYSVQGPHRTADAADTRPTEYKVPTLLEYPNPDDADKQTYWGYLCARPGESSKRELKELFKFYLNEDTRKETEEKNPGIALPSVEEVQRFITDFVKELNEHVKKELGDRFSENEWRSANVEYHFSVPTTWPPYVNEKFREAIGDSGVGGGHNDTRSIILAEAEAAAVQVVKERVKKLKVCYLDAIVTQIPRLHKLCRQVILLLFAMLAAELQYVPRVPFMSPLTLLYLGYINH